MNKPHTKKSNRQEFTLFAKRVPVDLVLAHLRLARNEFHFTCSHYWFAWTVGQGSAGLHYSAVSGNARMGSDREMAVPANR